MTEMRGISSAHGRWIAGTVLLNRRWAGRHDLARRQAHARALRARPRWPGTRCRSAAPGSQGAKSEVVGHK